MPPVMTTTETPTDPERTLPSIHAALASRRDEQALLLTIVFHPDTCRIGHRVVEHSR